MLFADGRLGAGNICAIACKGNASSKIPADTKAAITDIVIMIDLERKDEEEVRYYLLCASAVALVEFVTVVLFVTV